MPHFFQEFTEAECKAVLNTVPVHELLLLDKRMNLNSNDYMCVYQDFKQDIYEVLQAENELFEKYHTINVIIPDYRTYPSEIKEGMSLYCAESGKTFKTYVEVETLKIGKGEVYISLTENELAALVKKVRASGLVIGQEVGIISFNETVLKDLLGISVVSTDFTAMGEIAANMILNQNVAQVRNKFSLIKRESL
jgi:hypothetical protein